MMPSIAVICLPSTRSAENRKHDIDAFPHQAQSIVDRNRKKHPEYDDASHSDKGADTIFSSGKTGDTDAAFASMGKIGAQNFRKIYVLAYGNEEGVENPRPINKEGDQFRASELVNKFVTIGGVGTAIKEHVESAIRSEHRGGNKQPRDFVLAIRLLACNTGSVTTEKGLFETNSAKSYVEDVLNSLVKDVKTSIEDVEAQKPQEFKNSQFMIKLSVSGPKGWNVITQDGKCVVYHAPPSKEKHADRAMKKGYNSLGTKEEISKIPALQDYILTRDENGIRADLTRCRAILTKYSGAPLTADKY